jgi:hypothetical protein
MALLSILCAWISHSLNWIKQRRAAMFYTSDLRTGKEGPFDQGVKLAPGGLWLFGEAGTNTIHYSKGDDPSELRRLFPEADFHEFSHP